MHRCNARAGACVCIARPGLDFERRKRTSSPSNNARAALTNVTVVLPVRRMRQFVEYLFAVGSSRSPDAARTRYPPSVGEVDTNALFRDFKYHFVIPIHSRWSKP